MSKLRTVLASAGVIAVLMPSLFTVAVADFQCPFCSPAAHITVAENSGGSARTGTANADDVGGGPWNATSTDGPGTCCH